MGLGSKPWQALFDITPPILIWGKVKLGVTPDINALATLIVLVVSVGVGLAAISCTAPRKSPTAISRWPLPANK